MNLDETTCKSPKCNAPIYWAISDRGTRIPLDVTPRTDGNIIFRDGRAHTITMFDQVGEHEARFMVHWATCPDAESFRRKEPTNGFDADRTGTHTGGRRRRRQR